MSVNSKIKKGFVWDLGSNFVRQLTSLIISIVLARILSPDEFGIVGMALVFIHISEVFIDVGFTSGLIQNTKISDFAYSSVFFLNIFIGILIGVLIFFTAPLIGSFYNEPKVEEILRYLAFVPIISAFGRVHSTLLTKDMNFKKLSIRMVIATFLAGGVGVIAAVNDFGVYSLVVQQLTLVASSTILLWYSSTWRPKWFFSWHEISSLFKYSSYVFIDQLFRQLFNKIDTLFIGKVFSPSILGFYSRAESLKSQIDTYATVSLRNVLFPALSVLQNDEDEFKSIFYKVSNLSTGLVIFILAPVFFLAEDIIIFLLGEVWQPSVIYFRILLVSTLSSPHISIISQTILAKGYSKLKFHIGLGQRIIKLSPILIGIIYGIIEFTIATTIASILIFFFYAFVLNIKLKISFFRQVKNFIVPSFIFFIFIFIFFYLNSNPYVLTVLFLFTYIILLRIMNHPAIYFMRDKLFLMAFYIRKMVIK
ncbi:lipopolysaccharide biosynthesis protein [Cytophagales bacterium LB-30]|uniref:Lipopolysaccharide biosynthesis protein n=1 Tax=Shiella aurantiaca TaxID=3058365 RepID=A0ABT8F9H2_9BACT|nr:lipopolysaccharide biosynthesis protein [Shiella aurantiaca]MDN4166611.1 lipopolysaccharide biosynthesis protein [Shiella aurantiaca]